MNINSVDSVGIESGGICFFTIRKKYVPTKEELQLLMSRITNWSCFNGNSSFVGSSGNYIKYEDIPISVVLNSDRLIMTFNCNEIDYYIDLNSIKSDIRDNLITELL